MTVAGGALLRQHLTITVAATELHEIANRLTNIDIAHASWSDVATYAHIADAATALLGIIEEGQNGPSEIGA